MIAPSRGRARVEIEGVTFESNEATDDGGAVYVAGGELVIKGDDNHFKVKQKVLCRIFFFLS